MSLRSFFRDIDPTSSTAKYGSVIKGAIKSVPVIGDLAGAGLDVAHNIGASMRANKSAPKPPPPPAARYTPPAALQTAGNMTPYLLAGAAALVAVLVLPKMLR